jgi:hypothetical protein
MPLACLPLADRCAMALGVRRDGSRERLGVWIETTEGAKFWMKVFNDLRSRGVSGILIALTDGLTGMAAVFPRTTPPDLHCASDPQPPGLRQLEGPQGAGLGVAADLRRCWRRGGGSGAGRVRGW